MKNLKTIIVTIALVSIALVSCSKEEVSPTPTPEINCTNFTCGLIIDKKEVVKVDVLGTESVTYDYILRNQCSGNEREINSIESYFVYDLLCLSSSW